MDIASRLVEFKNYCNLTNSEFCDKTDIPRPTLSQFLSGRNKRLSDTLAARIHEGFPNLNMMWLLFGEGNMLMDPNIEISEGKNQEKSEASQPLTSEHQQNRRQEPPSLFSQPNETNRENDDEDEEEQNFQREIRSEREKSNDGCAATVRAHPSKMVNHITVFYTDGSYDEFRPVKR